jgi:uncharacterized Zn-binding protein involved in type VI secretion
MTFRWVCFLEFLSLFGRDQITAIIGHIVLGDRTSHGGTVTSADPTWTINGQPIARVGDEVSCPRCRRTSIIVTSRFPSVIDSGQAAAFDQDRTDCGAVLYSRHNGHAGYDDGAGSAGNAAAVHPTGYQPEQALQFQEHFILRDSATGRPLAGWSYLVRTSEGQEVKGTTDVEGRTDVIWTGSPEPVEVTASPPVAKSKDPYHYGHDSPANYKGL